MTRRVGLLAIAAVLQLVALVLSHELVFLARYGSRFGEALVHSGHGETWSGAVTTSLLLGTGLAIVAGARLAWLSRLVRRHGDSPAPTRSLEPRALLRSWLQTGSRIAVVGVILLTVQENLERASIGAVAPGPGLLLSPEYAGGLWIALAVGFAVGLVAALFEWRHRALLARLRTRRLGRPRAAISPPRGSGIAVSPPLESIIGRRSALRAPPVVVAT